MPTSTASGRRYDSSGRRDQARIRRAAALDACLALFLERGFAATTMNAVAERAGVSAELLYKAIGPKAALAKAVWDATRTGDDEPLTEGFVPREISAAVGIQAKLETYAGLVTSVNERLAPLAAVLMDGGADAAQVVAETDAERLTGLRTFACHLAAEGLLSPDADPLTVADAWWALTGPHLFARLTSDRGWPVPQYQHWLATVLELSAK
ncbi:TetR/AcrR family transcriptional regulator [Kribbella sandramycini]|uniref:AcrR family transcriptional regulator n=1 Tax=Kribbella sandramycini TaxID=60450 RepID=A0A7Y4KXE6_9ACTN|nr:TetR/AcrR family transcriptional regulator [Kribbella sandramycini]MBB6569739.1 AcrR family transcriptional regulator [Kribbella sandramycini]NOL40432.1 TetR/AcrR family transcriptional regulator [Kribbella sandramycini]